MLASFCPLDYCIQCPLSVSLVLDKGNFWTAKYFLESLCPTSFIHKCGTHRFVNHRPWHKYLLVVK